MALARAKTQMDGALTEFAKFPLVLICCGKHILDNKRFLYMPGLCHEHENLHLNIRHPFSLLPYSSFIKCFSKRNLNIWIEVSYVTLKDVGINYKDQPKYIVQFLVT